MASFWFIFSVLLYIISECIAVQMRITPQDSKYLGLDENLRLKREIGLFRQRIQKIRNRRDAKNNVIPSECGKGKVYALAVVPHCHVTNAEYDAKMKKCLVKILHVPGMPDGPKGYIYVAYNHFLYKAYDATNRRILVRCPVPTTTKPSTTTPAKVSLTSTTKLKVAPTITLKPVGASKTTSKPATPGSTPNATEKISLTNTTKLATMPTTSTHETQQQTSKPNSSQIVLAAPTAKQLIKPTTTTKLKPTTPVMKIVQASIKVNSSLVDTSS